MVLYSPRKRPPLSAYGIAIPVAPDRSARVFEALCSHADLGPLAAAWHIHRDGAMLDREDLLRVHDRGYVERLFSDRAEEEIVRAFELLDENGAYRRYDPSRAVRPLAELARVSLENASAVTQCCRESLERGFCFFLGGGHHHAHYDFGHGFCVLNDTVIALRKLQAEGAVRNAWVIDVDAHKGDGTAALTQNDASIITLSVHMARGWPLDGERTDERGNVKPAFLPSDIDVPVEQREEALYNGKLEAALKELAGRPPADIAVVVSGSDPYEKDTLPSASDLRLTAAQMLDRDLLIWNFLSGRQIPRAYLMAGGYGPDSWEVYPPFLEHVLVRHFGLET